MQRQAVEFHAFVVEAFGGFSAEARALIRRITNYADRDNCPWTGREAYHNLISTIAVGIQVGNARCARRVHQNNVFAGRIIKSYAPPPAEPRAPQPSTPVRVQPVPASAPQRAAPAAPHEVIDLSVDEPRPSPRTPQVRAAAQAPAQSPNAGLLLPVELQQRVSGIVSVPPSHNAGPNAERDDESNVDDDLDDFGVVDDDADAFPSPSASVRDRPARRRGAARGGFIVINQH